MDIAALENLAAYMDRRATYHMRNGDMARAGQAWETAAAHRKEINRRKDAAALTS